ncbi:MAG: hypothetical protein HYZ14_09560 [Bacteroidetes bacterium]|nr:hypothetical protein [Bacteroidota bacterium]
MLPSYRLIGLDDKYIIKIMDGHPWEGYSYGGRLVNIRIHIYNETDLKLVKTIDLAGTKTFGLNEGYGGVTRHNNGIYFITTAPNESNELSNVLLRKLNFEEPYISEDAIHVGTSENGGTAGGTLRFYSFDSESENVEAYYTIWSPQSTKELTHQIKIYNAETNTWTEQVYQSGYEYFGFDVMTVAENGDFGILGYPYRYGYNNKDDASGKENPVYIIYTSENSFKSEQINIDDKFVRNTSIYTLENGKFLVVGTYGDKRYDEDGFFSIIIADGEENQPDLYPFDADFIREHWEKMPKNNSEKGIGADPAYEWCLSPEVYFCEDHSIVMVTKVFHKIGLEHPNDTVYDPGAVYNELIVLKINESGELIWKKNVFWNLNTDKEGNHPYEMSEGYYTNYFNGKLYLIYNEIEKVKDSSPVVNTRIMSISDQGESEILYEIKQARNGKLIRPEFSHMPDSNRILLYTAKGINEKIGLLKLDH